MLPIKRFQKISNSQLQILILLLLCLQNSSFVLALRYTRSVLKQQYCTTSTLIYTEVLKLLFSLIIIRGKRLKLVLQEAYILLPPAFIYYVQNFLMYVALRNLDAATYSVLVQIKILTGAIFFVLLLGKEFSLAQWRALVLLVIGVIMVQLQPENAAEGSESHPRKKNNAIGVISGVGVACCSGLAGVYFEKVLKQSKGAKHFSIWDRNIQLAVWSIMFGLLHLLKDSGEIIEKGFFHDFNWFTHLVIIWSSLGGLLVGLAVKHVNSVVKNFANACGMIITSCVSIFLFNKQMHLVHWLGVMIVSISLFNYQQGAVKRDKTFLPK